MTTFTPGPWDWTDGDGEAKWVFAPGDDRFGYVAVQGEANARLIARAPELYAALKEALDYLEHDLIGYSKRRDATVKQARAAISQVEA